MVIHNGGPSHESCNSHRGSAGNLFKLSFNSTAGHTVAAAECALPTNFAGARAERAAVAADHAFGGSRQSTGTECAVCAGRPRGECVRGAVAAGEWRAGGQA